MPIESFTISVGTIPMMLTLTMGVERLPRTILIGCNHQMVLSSGEGNITEA
jgi:hypothetical protein